MSGASLSEDEEEEGANKAPLSQPVMLDDVLVNGICTEKDTDGSPTGGSSPRSGGEGGQMLTGASSRRGAAHTDEGGLSSEPVAKLKSPAEAKNDSSGPSVECFQALDFAKLRWRLEQLRGNTSADLESVRGSNRCGSSSMPRRKSEAQIMKIVKLLKRKLPQCSEADIRRHVDHMRRLRGGFSCMTLCEIVDLVLRHVIGKMGKEEKR